MEGWGRGRTQSGGAMKSTKQNREFNKICKEERNELEV